METSQKDMKALKFSIGLMALSLCGCFYRTPKDCVLYYQALNANKQAKEDSISQSMKDFGCVDYYLQARKFELGL